MQVKIQIGEETNAFWGTPFFRAKKSSQVAWCIQHEIQNALVSYRIIFLWRLST